MCFALQILLLLMLLLTPDPVRPFAIDNGVKDVQLLCTDDGLHLRIQTQNVPTAGRFYVKGRLEQSECQKPFTTGTVDQQFNVFLSSCGMEKTGVRGEHQGPHAAFTLVVVVSFHDMFVTKVDRAYKLTCMYGSTVSSTQLTNSLEVSMLTPTDIQQTAGMPDCSYDIHADSANGPLVHFTLVGMKVVHVWSCRNLQKTQFIWIHDCYVVSERGNQVSIIDSQGCTHDRVIIDNVAYPSASMAIAMHHAYQFADMSSLHFRCQIDVCNSEPRSCSIAAAPPLCPGTNVPPIGSQLETTANTQQPFSSVYSPTTTDQQTQPTPQPTPSSYQTYSYTATPQPTPSSYQTFSYTATPQPTLSSYQTFSYTATPTASGYGSGSGSGGAFAVQQPHVDPFGVQQPQQTVPLSSPPPVRSTYGRPLQPQPQWLFVPRTPPPQSLRDAFIAAFPVNLQQRPAPAPPASPFDSSPAGSGSFEPFAQQTQWQRQPYSYQSSSSQHYVARHRRKTGHTVEKGLTFDVASPNLVVFDEDARSALAAAANRSNRAVFSVPAVTPAPQESTPDDGDEHVWSLPSSQGSSQICLSSPLALTIVCVLVFLICISVLGWLLAAYILRRRLRSRGQENLSAFSPVKSFLHIKH